MFKTNFVLIWRPIPRTVTSLLATMSTTTATARESFTAFGKTMKNTTLLTVARRTVLGTRVNINTAITCMVNLFLHEMIAQWYTQRARRLDKHLRLPVSLLFGKALMGNRYPTSLWNISSHIPGLEIFVKVSCLSFASPWWRTSVWLTQYASECTEPIIIARRIRICRCRWRLFVQDSLTVEICGTKEDWGFLPGFCRCLEMRPPRQTAWNFETPWQSIDCYCCRCGCFFQDPGRWKYSFTQMGDDIDPAFHNQVFQKQTRSFALSSPVLANYNQRTSLWTRTYTVYILKTHDLLHFRLLCAN